MAETAGVAAQYGAVYRFIRRRARSREDAEDLTQEVFLGAIAALGEARLPEGETPLGWLYAVAQRRLIDRVRSESRHGVRLCERDAVAEPAYGAPVVSSLVSALAALERGQPQGMV